MFSTTELSLLSFGAPILSKAKYHCTEGTNHTRLFWACFGTNMINCWLPFVLWVWVGSPSKSNIRDNTTMIEIDKPLSLSVNEINSSLNSTSRHSSCLVLYDLLYDNIRQSNSAISAYIICWKTEWGKRNTNSIVYFTYAYYWGSGISINVLFVQLRSFMFNKSPQSLRFTILQ